MLSEKYNINSIEKLTEKQAQELAEEKTTFKGFNIYFIDFGGAFGYSVCVFANNHHIYYVNDYQLHHNYNNPTKEQLKEKYLNGLKYKLFTLDDMKTVSDYNDYNAKDHFIRNYLIQKYDYISMFGIFRSSKDEEIFEKKVSGKIPNYIAFCYVDDPEIIKESELYLNTLKEAHKNLFNSYDYWFKAFEHEMYNHEYVINLQADYDVISCFATLHFVDSIDELQDYFKQANFNEMQIKAYLDARKSVIKNSNY